MTRWIALIVLVAASALAVSGTALGVSRYQQDAQFKVVTAYFDGCVRGQWREVEFAEESEIEGEGAVTLTGSGRLVRFENGVETVEYGQGITYTGGTAWYQVSVERAGTVSYRVLVDGDQLSFTGLSANGTERILINGIELGRQALGLNSAPLRYACEGDRLILTDAGYRSVLERVKLAP
ncbi:MAG: hypothetical protein H0T78_00715 [Longispora sp.]|nr:hypothetical protein [Longispora sp. (in: high G+C Gram-positive bacteria)]